MVTSDSKREKIGLDKEYLVSELIRTKEEVISAKDGHMLLLNDLIKDLKAEASEKDDIIKNQAFMIKTFRNSIVYPLFRFTSSFGRTRLGRIIQRIIKG